MWVKPGARVTVALSVARLTSASWTPGVRLRARSTRETQEAQVMPEMARIAWAPAGGASSTLTVRAGSVAMAVGPLWDEGSYRSLWARVVTLNAPSARPVLWV